MRKILFGIILALSAFLVMQAHAAAPTTNTAALEAQLLSAEQTLAQLQALQPTPIVTQTDPKAALLAQLQSVENALAELQSLQAAQASADAAKVRPVLADLSVTLSSLQAGLQTKRVIPTDRPAVAASLDGIDQNLTALRAYPFPSEKAPIASTVGQQTGNGAVASAGSQPENQGSVAVSAGVSDNKVAENQNDNSVPAEAQTATVGRISWKDSMPALIAVLVVLGIILLARRGGKPAPTPVKKTDVPAPKEQVHAPAPAPITPVVTQSQTPLDPQRKPA